MLWLLPPQRRPPPPAPDVTTLLLSRRPILHCRQMWHGGEPGEGGELEEGEGGELDGGVVDDRDEVEGVDGGGASRVDGGREGCVVGGGRRWGRDEGGEGGSDDGVTKDKKKKKNNMAHNNERRYMAESPHSSGDEVPTTSRRTRGATRLRQLILRRNAGERTPIIIDVVTGVASGPNADVFRSYLGVLARDRISILTPSFDHVSEADRNLIWQDLLITFDMPNIESLRNKCLSAIAERFRGFKTKLTSKFSTASVQITTEAVGCNKKKTSTASVQTTTEAVGILPRVSTKPRQKELSHSNWRDALVYGLASICWGPSRYGLVASVRRQSRHIRSMCTVYEAVIVVHDVELAEDEVKVTVDEVVVPDALLHVPTSPTALQWGRRYIFPLYTWVPTEAVETNILPRFNRN
ncbi:hypothetical protein LR48_Vigan10g202900 [Vigna angularis]|uniref:Uncharacterized protein n=1 Tax=Phaseolus angularis TaxID=3914 RepID=A0A0L9VML2_PHAAN|nr:hypothetical protein LR48_Vigan10g202900 [Vigna angularis]